MIITIGPLSPPSKFFTYISNDCPAKELAFVWSPVAPDCPAIHYNILASNCGSCPTTTNHTNATCTDVPTNGSVCTFAVQTVACGNITGNESEPVSIIFDAMKSTGPTNVHHMTEILGKNNLDTNIPYTTSISLSFLATALIISIAVSITVIVIILKRSKAKIKALETQLTDTAGESMHMEPMYEDVTGPVPSVSVAINTQDNVAYGHTRTSTTAL